MMMSRWSLQMLCLKYNPEKKLIHITKIWAPVLNNDYIYLCWQTYLIATTFHRVTFPFKS